MLLTNGSIVIPNDDNNIINENSDSFMREFVNDVPISVNVSNLDCKLTGRSHYIPLIRCSSQL